MNSSCCGSRSEYIFDWLFSVVVSTTASQHEFCVIAEMWIVAQGVRYWKSDSQCSSIQRTSLEKWLDHEVSDLINGLTHRVHNQMGSRKLALFGESGTLKICLDSIHPLCPVTNPFLSLLPAPYELRILLLPSPFRAMFLSCSQLVVHQNFWVKANLYLFLFYMLDTLYQPK